MEDDSAQFSAGGAVSASHPSSKKEVALLSSFRSMYAFALAAFAVLALAAPASAQTTPVGGLQQLPAPHNCISTLEGDPSECGTIITGGTTDARSIAISPDGKSAYVASSGATNPGSLATFTRNQDTGELSYNACVSDPSSPETCGTELTQLAGASYVVVTNTGAQYVYVASSASDAVRAFSRNQTTGGLTPIAGGGGCIQEIGAGGCQEGDGLDGVEYLALSPDGLTLYAISSTQGTIAVLGLDPDTGAISQEEEGFVAQAGVRAADVSPDGAHLYAVSPNQSILVKYDRNAETGALTRDQCFRGTTSGLTACGGPQAAVNGINGVYDVEVVTTGAASQVYTVSRRGTSATQGSTLAVFDRSTTTGDLTADTCFRDPEASLETSCTQAEGLDDATSVTARPDGGAVYVTANGDNAITSFTRAMATGDLTRVDSAIDGTEQGLASVNEAAISPDSRFLYSTADADDAVAEFAIQYRPACPDITRDDVPAQTTVDITPTCTDVNKRDVLKLEVASNPPANEGTVEAVDTNADGRTDTLRYNPGNFIGTTSFTYRAVDDQGNASPPATVTVTVLTTGAPVISVSDAAASEGEDFISFTFQRSGPTTQTTTVTYSTENDTATAPGDYVAQTGQQVMFAVGQTTRTVNVPLTDDNVDEETERLRLRITNTTVGGGPAAAVSDALGVGTIADDDQAVASVGDATIAEGGETATLTVTLSNPSSRTVTVQYATGEGTATAPEDFTGSSGTVSFAPGDTSERIAIPIVNDTAVEPNEQFTVALSSPTEGASLGDATGQVTITDDDNPTVSISDESVAEGDTGTSEASFLVTLSAPTSKTVTVNYATGNGTATAGSDYAATNGTLTFSPGELTETIDVPVTGDNAEEADETFNVTLSAPTNATLGDGTGVGTIQNDDRDPAVSVSDASVAEGNADTRNAAFAVTLSEASASAVTVKFATANGTATAGSDYDATDGTLTFAAGETTKTVNVPVRGDTAVEDDETFTVTLSDATNADVGDGSGTGRILNDDQPTVEQPPAPAPRTGIVIGDTGVAEGDGGTRNAVFTIALSQAAAAPVSVDVTTVNGTALGGQDYRAGAARLTFAPGETTKTFPVAVVGDTTAEGDETFIVRLANAAGADIVKADGVGTIANDDIVRRRPGLSFTVSPRTDLTRPHVFTVTGTLTLPSGLTPAEACGTGRVSAQYKNGGNTISTRRAVLDAECRFTIRTPFNIRSRLRNARRLKLTVRFAGNRYLTARTAQPVFVRVRR